MPMPPVLNSIVGWLRAGYPYGVPENDYIPLLALLARRLTSEEVTAVTEELLRQTELADDPASNGSGHRNGHRVDGSDIGVLITKVTNELPRQEDVDRVRARLAAAGPFI